MRDVLRGVRLWLITAVRAAPLLVVAQAVVTVAQAVSAPVQTYGVKLLVDGLTDSSATAIAWGIGVILAGFTAMLAGNIVSGPVRETTGNKVFIQVFQDLLRTTTSVPGITHHEHQATAKRIQLVRENAWKLGVSFELLLVLVGTLANTVAVLALLTTVHPLLLLLPLLGTARVWSAYLSTRWQNDAAEAMMPQARLVDDLIDIIHEGRHALELRVFGLRTEMVNRLRQAQDLRGSVENRATTRGALLDTAVRIGFGLTYVLAILWVISQARRGQLTVGDVALVILVAPQVDQLTGGIAGSVYQLGDILRTFMRLDWLLQYAKRNSWTDASQPPPPRLQSGIDLHSVCFRYPTDSTKPTRPGTDQLILTDITLHLPAGSTVALVGENGAGKTTLVKLLARMYNPTSGEIFIDGVNLESINPQAWREHISAGFQNFVKFELPLRESVGIGDLPRLNDSQALATALEQADATSIAQNVPHGIDTQLGTRFTNGTELSGGQWQRLALARAFMRQQPLLLLLDEPTAALDPEAEHTLFEQFANASKATARETGGITILVSHRFSTVRMADLIVVLDKGHIHQVGTHEQLLATDGRYTELFNIQAQAYR